MNLELIFRHKVLIAAALAGALLAALTLAIGYVWGSGTATQQEQWLSVRKSEAALELVEDLDPDATDALTDDAGVRVSRAQYVKWLENKVKSQHATLQAPSTPASAATVEPTSVASVPEPEQVAADYRALAQLVALGSQWMEGRETLGSTSPAQSKLELERSRRMVHAVEATWLAEQRPALGLPDDLFVPRARPIEAVPAKRAAMSSARPLGLTNSRPKVADSATSGLQVDVIRKAVQSFNEQPKTTL